MNHDRALYWVQHNRTPRDRTQNAAAGVSRLVEDLVGPRWQSAMTAAGEACARLVDDEFRNRCRLALSDARTLTILVDAPAMVPVFRRRWEREILRELSALRGRFHITRVNFEFGAAGLAVPPARDLRRTLREQDQTE